MSDRVMRRATLLARLYPRQWRDQFPEFVDVLAEELAERPRGVQRDVLRSAATERLREVGIIPKKPADRARSGLALIYAALLLFAGLAMGMWSQLHTGLAANRVATSPALDSSNRLMTAGTLVVLVALPLAVGLVVADSRRISRRGGAGGRPEYRRFLGPSLTLVGSLTALMIAGWSADRSGWYSPAAAALPRQGPVQLATLWTRGVVATITPAWIHPTLFAQMPLGELLAALLAPVAMLGAASALFRLIMRCPLAQLGRANVVLAAGAFGMMSVSVVACGRWLIDHPGREGVTAMQAHHDQLAPGHTGWLVVILLTALTVIALAGLRRILGSHPEEPARPSRCDPRTVTEDSVTGGTGPLFFSVQ